MIAWYYEFEKIVVCSMFITNTFGSPSKIQVSSLGERAWLFSAILSALIACIYGRLFTFFFWTDVDDDCGLDIAIAVGVSVVVIAIGVITVRLLLAKRKQNKNQQEGNSSTQLYMLHTLFK